MDIVLTPFPMRRVLRRHVAPNLRGKERRKVLRIANWGRPSELEDFVEALQRHAHTTADGMALLGLTQALEEEAPEQGEPQGKWITFWEKMSELLMKWASYIIDNWDEIAKIIKTIVGFF